MNSRNLFAGVTAGFLLATGAGAADLPVKAKADAYVKVCSPYGVGFFFIPETDTCLKLGGYLRVDTTFAGGVHGQPAYNGDLGQANRFRDYWVGRSRSGLTVDTRTATEYGLLRTFGQFEWQFNNFGTSNPTFLNTIVFPLPYGFNSTLLSTADGGYTPVAYMFIQFAGFTIGKSFSAYATPWQAIRATPPRT